MTRRDIAIVLGTLVVAIGLSAILFVGAAATAPASSVVDVPARPRVFFDQQQTLPAARSVADAQRRVPAPLAAFVPLQRGISDTARDAAGLLLTLLLTATTLVLANDQVVATYRASLGDWRSQARVLVAGFIVLGLAVSTAALAWVVYLSFVTGTLREAAPFGAPLALQVGLTAFAVFCVFALLVLLVGFAATAWRLGDALLHTRALSRFQTQIPAPVVALAGATIFFVLWQLPAVGAFALAAVIAYALGAVVTARLVKEGMNT